MKKIILILFVVFGIMSLAGCDLIIGTLSDLFGDDDDDDYTPPVYEDSYEQYGDNFPENATPLYANSPQTHSLHTTSDVDWFVIDVATGTPIAIEIYPVSGGVGITDVDFYVYDQSVADYVAYGTSTAGNSTEYLEFTTEGTAPFFVKVEPYSGTGNYNIIWYYL